MAVAVQGQFDLASDPGEVFDPVPWLAFVFVGANELCMIHRGDLEGARSRIAGSCQGRYDGNGKCEVYGGKVSWCRGGKEGTVTAKALVDYAASRHDPAVAGRLVEAYREYVRTATVDYTLARSSPEYQADPDGNEARARAASDAREALSQAEAAWWSAEPAGEQFALF